MSIGKYKYTILIMFLIAGAFLGYQNFIAGKEGLDPLLVISSGADVDGSIAGREIVKLRAELNSLDLSHSFVDSEAFKSLVDYEQEVFFEPVGRSDPFAPIGSGGAYTGQPIDVYELLKEEI